MRLALLGIFLLSVHVLGTSPPCDDFSCASREVLLETIRLQQERLVSFENATCDICGTQPCLNDGKCVADVNSPWDKYHCLCPGNFSGDHCETEIKCESDTCGPNAECFVSNHQTNCVCQLGYSSNDPTKGCYEKVVRACGSGVLHFQTFDGLYFDYSGTCPYVFSQPRGNLSGGYDNFKVVAKNELFWGTQVSTVSEVEVTMHDQKIHIDRRSRNVYFNGYKINLPFYYPSVTEPKVTITYSGRTFYVRNDQLMVVSLDAGGVCLQIPDVPELRGQDTLCGLAGNFDNNFQNDVVYQNGTVYQLERNYQPTSENQATFNNAEDSWITEDFLALRDGQQHCLSGEILGNNTDCNPQPAVAACDPILQAMSKRGVFAECYPMGNDTIKNFYHNCVYDVCHGSPKCAIIPTFAKACMEAIPNTDLGPWRKEIKCPIVCPVNTQYSSCTSSCPWTCSDQSLPKTCDKPCTEGCECLPGYVLDTTQLESTTCVPLKECGCTDKQGNLHPADQPWMTDNCQVSNVCINGTLVEIPTACGKSATCGKDSDGNMACVCGKGYAGDGYTCTDIDECLDPKVCNQDKGQGICTNLPGSNGSYICNCSPSYTGKNCEVYAPRRHCADLYVYWGIRRTGAYTINPPYEVNGKPAFTGIRVHCNMDLFGGGWTLLSHHRINLMAHRTFAEYEAGFGDPQSTSAWLGLDLASKMTAEMPTSLDVFLHRCATPMRGEIKTNCIYPYFLVGNKSTNYAVTIPEACKGSENNYTVGADGWVKWDKNGMGPSFKSFDKDDALNCSKSSKDTGFWFDEKRGCGGTNLNGAHISCENPPTDTYASYLLWNGRNMKDAAMLLRPKDYPNYDPIPPRQPVEIADSSSYSDDYFYDAF